MITHSIYKNLCTHTHTHTHTHTFCHSDHPSIGSHHHHAEVGGVSRHAKYGRLQVLLMTSKVYEGDDFGGGTTYLCPVQATWGGGGGGGGERVR